MGRNLLKLAPDLLLPLLFFPSARSPAAAVVFSFFRCGTSCVACGSFRCARLLSSESFGAFFLEQGGRFFFFLFLRRGFRSLTFVLFNHFSALIWEIQSGNWKSKRPSKRDLRPSLKKNERTEFKSSPSSTEKTNRNWPVIGIAVRRDRTREDEDEFRSVAEAKTVELPNRVRERRPPGPPLAAISRSI